MPTLRSVPWQQARNYDERGIVDYVGSACYLWYTAISKCAVAVISFVWIEFGEGLPARIELGWGLPA